VNKARIGLIDDHPLFRQGLAAVLRQSATFDVVGEASNAQEAIELVRNMRLDLAVVDILMPSVSGLSLTSELYELQPTCRVLGLSVIDEPGIIADMLRAHACGYALKTQPITQIVEAIEQVLGGIRYLPPTVSSDQIETELTGTPAHPHRMAHRLRTGQEG